MGDFGLCLEMATQTENTKRIAGTCKSDAFLPLVLGGCAFLGRVLLVSHGHCAFETANTLSDSFAEFWKFFRAEHEQSNSKDHEQMHGLKKSFEHCVSLSLLQMFFDREPGRCGRSFPYAAPAPGNNPLFAHRQIGFDRQSSHEVEELFRLADEESVRGESIQRRHGSAFGVGRTND